MSDTLVAESGSGAVFVECLGIPKRLTSTKITRYEGAEPSDRRAMAVACALELIKANVSAGGDLGTQLEYLSSYANLIEGALETE